MKMAEIRPHGYHVHGLPENQHVKQINNLKYVDHLAMVTNTDVSDWPIDVFKNTSGGIYLDRQKINEVFFEFKKKADETPKIVPKINLPAVLALETMLNKRFDQVLTNASVNLQDYQRQLDAWARDGISYQRNVAYGTMVLQSVQTLKAKGFNLTYQIEEILKADFWTLSETTVRLEFISKPVTITYFNEAQKRNNAVFLGCLNLGVSIDERGYLSCTVAKGRDAGHPHGEPHPHVNSSGNICWGSLGPAAQKAMATMNLVQLCDIVRRVVTSYNEGDAYRNIYNYTALDTRPAGSPELEEDPVDEEPEEDYEEDRVEDYEPEDEPENEDVDF